MFDVFLWSITMAMTAVPIWILLKAVKEVSVLDSRLAENDATLLNEKGIIITQMTALPPNSVITHNANIVVSQNPNHQM
ncbi:MAG: hypothetical protein CMA72_02730 [Euryarchaeota archaeon]|jgi:hypothetical protein|nr:hypothetical protein [Euryarchaeota archaeon]|tara:strand:- start:3798 stop:4034 length:237 start_codon:yes stop_codon:yes gene_type:complete